MSQSRTWVLENKPCLPVAIYPGIWEAGDLATSRLDGED